MEEKDAMLLIRTMIKALIHCHANGIIHRDIKLENIMFNTSEIVDYSDIQIIDFGLATSTENNSIGLLNTIVGSPYFTAPEVFEGKYGKEWDIWSCGVVLYVLLSGYYPYNSGTASGIYAKIQKQDPTFPYDQWHNVSDEAQDLLTKMLERSPKLRISFEECLKHKWFKKFDESPLSKSQSSGGKFNID